MCHVNVAPRGHASCTQQQQSCPASTIDMSGRTWISTWTKDRSKRSYWVPTTVSWPHTSRLVPMGNLEGWSLSTKASHTRNNGSVTCSHDTRHTDSRCLAADGRHFEHIMSHSLSPRKNCIYMSLCSKDIDYQRVSVSTKSTRGFEKLWRGNKLS
jgi:hypothetical protein